MAERSEIGGAAPVPPPQNNLQTAVELATANLRGQDPEQLAWLGAERTKGDGDQWRLTVLGRPVDVHVDDGRVLGPDGQPVRPKHQVIVLHYLAVRARPEMGRPEVTFAHLPDGRVYAAVYQGRVLGRLCGTCGRDEESIRKATALVGAEAVDAPTDGSSASSSLAGAVPVPSGSLAFDIPVLPRLSARLIWQAGDDEFGPSATILLPSNISALFCIEDVVVLSEMLITAMCGRGL